MTSHASSDPKAQTRRWELLLYIAGMKPATEAAIATLRDICETHLPGEYSLEIVDLFEQPHRAANDEVFAVPTLIRNLPHPRRKLVGDMSNVEKVLEGLELRPRATRGEG